MLTPKFWLHQTEECVVAQLHLPWIRVGDAEVHVDGQEFSFYCKPYLLKLTFPAPLKGSEDVSNCTAVYNAAQDNGTMTLYLRKAEKGRHFPDLDLTTKLMTASQMPTFPGYRVPPTIEVISSEPASELDKTVERASSSCAKSCSCHTDTRTPQKPEQMLQVPRYGFNRQYSGVFQDLRDDLLEVVRLSKPERTPEIQRRQLREAQEETDFDCERYLADTIWAAEDPVFELAISLRPFWEQAEPEVTFTVEERAEMSELKQREYLVEEDQPIWSGLLDLLLAFTYDHRTTGGEPTVESCWTITVLSSCLSWLETYREAETSSSDLQAVTSVLRAFVRRSLTYPYLRSWDLCILLLTDVGQILRRGRKIILRCLLQMRRVLRRTESYYLLNRIFIDDYCIYLQQASVARISEVAEAYGVALCRFSKSEVGLHLEDVEQLVEEHEEGKEDVVAEKDNCSSATASRSPDASVADSMSGEGSLDREDLEFLEQLKSLEVSSPPVEVSSPPTIGVVSPNQLLSEMGEERGQKDCDAHLVEVATKACSRPRALIEPVNEQ